jgi:hypothetical protein
VESEKVIIDNKGGHQIPCRTVTCNSRSARVFKLISLRLLLSEWSKNFSDLMHLARAVKFCKHCLSCSGSRSYWTGKHCVSNFTLEGVRIIRNSKSSSPLLLRSNNNECSEFRSYFYRIEFLVLLNKCQCQRNGERLYLTFFQLQK